MQNLSEALATIFLGLVGLWIGNNYRRQMRSALTHQASESYARLWELTSVADPISGRPLTGEQMKRLACDMSEWYFRDGNGMYLPTSTRRLFFALVENLDGQLDRFTPVVSRERMRGQSGDELEFMRGCVCKRQVSLLRTQLKNDMAVYYSVATFNFLRDDEHALLAASGIRPRFTALPLAIFMGPSRHHLSLCLCRRCPNA
jgi:hypothetical protein